MREPNPLLQSADLLASGLQMLDSSAPRQHNTAYCRIGAIRRDDRRCNSTLIAKSVGSKTIEGKQMATWVEDISTAYANLGGVARYEDVYREVRRIRGETLPTSWRDMIRGIVEDNSSDSAKFKGKDLFYSANGIGKGIWGLRSAILSTPFPSDLGDPEPGRVAVSTYRILRDTILARTIKALHSNRCQLCDNCLLLPGGTGYSEAHHIRPLGRPHNGPDIAANILVLCPNHHVLFDYGSIRLDLNELRQLAEHKVGHEFVDYHNDQIFGHVGA
jgi:predicted restriction endonuclease